MFNMNACTRNNRFIRELLILLLIVSVTGNMLSGTRPDLKSGAVLFGALSTAPEEPVLGAVYADTFHEADPNSGIAAMQTVQGRLLALSKADKEKQDSSLYLVVLLICSVIAGGLCIQRYLRRNLSRLILRSRVVIIYIYSQDGAKA